MSSANVTGNSLAGIWFKTTELDVVLNFGWQCGAAVFCVIVLMRDVILQEIATWGINFARVALYAAEGITVSIPSKFIFTNFSRLSFSLKCIQDKFPSSLLRYGFSFADWT
jgi:hypothetical protein